MSARPREGAECSFRAFGIHDAWAGSDIARTEDLIGARSGLLVPHPMLLISPRLYRLLKDEEIKGCEVEVAHLA